MARNVKSMKCQVIDWDPYLDTMPPGPSQLRVNGRAECPAAGYSLHVVRDDPQGINQKILRLRLEEQVQNPGAQVVSEVSFSYAESAGVGQFDSVTLTPGGTKKIRIIS